MIIFSLADRRKSLYQWDSNVQVEIIAETGKTVTEAHFAYLGASGESLSVEVSEKDGKYYAKIPNILLQKARKIICYAYVTGENGNKTIEHHIFNVIARQKPADYVYTETETKNWSSLEKRIEELEKGGGSGSGSGSGGITTETDPTVPNWAKQPTKPTYTADEVGAEPSGAVSNHNTSSDAHNDIRLLVSELTSRLNSLADSDDTTLDQLSEIVAYIKNNKSLIDSITTGKVSVSDIIDNLTTNASNKPLSASQGVALKALIDGITIPEKLPNPQALTFTGAVTDTYDGSEAKTINIPSGGSGGSEYTLPIATSETLGGVKPVAKTETMTQEVGVDENGGLFTNPSSGSSGGEEKWEIINDIEITEEANRLEISTDSNGESFSLKKLKLCYYFPKYDGESTINAYFFFILNGKLSGNGSPLLYTSAFKTVSTANVVSGFVEVEILTDNGYRRELSDYVSNGGYNFFGGTLVPNYKEAIGLREDTEIHQIGLSNSLLPVGSHFVLMGVRA